MTYVFAIKYNKILNIIYTYIHDFKKYNLNLNLAINNYFPIKKVKVFLKESTFVIIVILHCHK